MGQHQALGGRAVVVVSRRQCDILDVARARPHAAVILDLQLLAALGADARREALERPAHAWQVVVRLGGLAAGAGELGGRVLQPGHQQPPEHRPVGGAATHFQRELVRVVGQSARLDELLRLRRRFVVLRAGGGRHAALDEAAVAPEVEVLAGRVQRADEALGQALP
eukprot:630002-Prymnesium_polylepis.2